MDNQITEIAERISSLRDIEGVSVAEMAEITGKTPREYEAYEAGERDFSFSFLFNVANRLGVDITELLTGENARLRKYACVKAGAGLKMERRKAYKYQHLAAVFQERHMEPFLVTVEPKDTEAVKKHAHDGQELNYVVEGSMTMLIGEVEMRMDVGDSIYFDAATPHAMRAEGGSPCRFLAVISK
jgi:mannose-6-phosphate isomerase-like protein (cupin superfamily)